MAVSKETRKAIEARYPDDPEVQALVKASRQADHLLERALWEFGVELRGEIEAYFGEKPLVGG